MSNEVVYAPANRCIYCDNPGPYGKEHIIPYGLGGEHILPQASCGECQTITSKFERICLKQFYGEVRVIHKIQTRRPQNRPAALPIIVDRDGVETHLGDVLPENYPVGMLGFLLPEPGIFRGAQPSTVIENAKGWFALKDKHTNYPDGMRLGTINFRAFEQMIAKIAHSFCVANYGLTSFKPILKDFIRDKADSGFYFVGGEEKTPPVDRGGMHKMRTYTEKHSGVEYLMTEVRLFCSFGAPTYYAVVGEV